MATRFNKWGHLIWPPETMVIWLANAEKQDPDGAVCAHCGGLNEYVDDCGFWYPPESGRKAICEECYHKLGCVHNGER